MRKLALILCLLLSAATPAVAGSDAELAENTPLFTKANGTSQGYLVAGTEVSILEEEGDWVKVTVTGWLQKSSLAPIGSRVDYMAKPPEWEYETQGFRFRNLSFQGHDFYGEISSVSSKSYRLARFILTVYDGNGKILGVGRFTVSNLRPGETKTFDGLIDKQITEPIKYRIDFDDGI